METFKPILILKASGLLNNALAKKQKAHLKLSKCVYKQIKKNLHCYTYINLTHHNFHHYFSTIIRT